MESDKFIQLPPPNLASVPAMAAACGLHGVLVVADHSPWPAGLRAAFCERLAAHGVAVDQRRLDCDGPYALRVLAAAHNEADEALRYLAVQLFRHFEHCLPPADAVRH